MTTPMGTDPPSGKWRFAMADPSVMGDPRTKDLVDEAMNAAPTAFLEPGLPFRCLLVNDKTVADLRRSGSVD